MKKLLLSVLVFGMCTDSLAVSTETTATMVDDIEYYYDQMLPYVGPFSYGFMVGAATGCLETEIINPIISYVLKGWSDLLVVAVEAGIIGGAGYMACKDQKSATTTLKKPATLLGVLAGVIAWYNFHG